MTEIRLRQDDEPPLKVVPARYPLRLVGAVFSLFILLVIVQSIATNPRWEWSVFRQWFFEPVILEGLAKTLLLTLLGTLFGIIFGTALALARLSKSYLLNALAWGYLAVPFTAAAAGSDYSLQLFLSVRQLVVRHSFYLD